MSSYNRPVQLDGARLQLVGNGERFTLLIRRGDSPSAYCVTPLSPTELLSVIEHLLVGYRQLLERREQGGYGTASSTSIYAGQSEGGGGGGQSTLAVSEDVMNALAELAERRCPERDSGGYSCELVEGHAGPHRVAQATIDRALGIRRSERSDGSDVLERLADPKAQRKFDL